MDTRHATAVLLGDRGVLIRGASASGKSLLALMLLSDFAARGRFARLVADDRVILRRQDGRLVARVPDGIAGLIEVRGLGLSPMPYERRAVIDLVIDLVGPESAPRLPDATSTTLEGATVGHLLVSERDLLAGAAAVTAWIGPY